MKRSLPIVLLLSLIAPSLSAAQEAPARRFDSARYVPVQTLLAVDAAPSSVAASDATAGESMAAEREGRSLLRTVLHTLGGAVVGGWVGFVGSQVTLSDWEKETNGSFSSERKAWVAGGMVVGMLGSRLIGGTTAPRSTGVEVRRPRTGRNVLTREQIQSSGATNVYDLVHAHRKEWLVPRGTNSFKESARGSGSGMGSDARLTSTPGKAAVVVYLDDIRLGEIERMREIMINDIMEIRFIEPQEAAYRYGSGHSHGVIHLSTSVR